MATLNFPGTIGQPTDGNFTYTENGVIYTWNGTYWSANNATDLDNRYVNVTGDTMTGDLTVPNLESAGDVTAVDVTAVDVVATGDIQSTSQNGGQLAGFRNQIINGNNNIFQRGTSATVSTSIGYYTADRWYVGGTNGSTNAIAPTGASGANFPFVWQNTLSAAGQYRQRIELFRNGQNAPFVPNSVWTLSFWSTQPVNEISVQFARFIATPNTAGTNVTSTALTAIDTQSTWTRYSSNLTIDQNASGSDNCFEISIAFTNASNLTGVQLEPGPVATPFEHRPIGTELALAQRYYVNLPNIELIGATMNSGSVTRFFEADLPVAMRAAPSAITGALTNIINDGTFSRNSPNSTTSVQFTGSTATISSPSYIGGVSCDAEL